MDFKLQNLYIDILYRSFIFFSANQTNHQHYHFTSGVTAGISDSSVKTSRLQLFLCAAKT